MAIDINYSPEQHDSFSMDYQHIPWWCSRCQCEHYTFYCPMEEYERLAKSWKDSRYYDYCPHCGKLIRREV